MEQIGHTIQTHANIEQNLNNDDVPPLTLEEVIPTKDTGWPSIYSTFGQYYQLLDSALLQQQHFISTPSNIDLQSLQFLTPKLLSFIKYQRIPAGGCISHFASFWENILQVPLNILSTIKYGILPTVLNSDWETPKKPKITYPLTTAQINFLNTKVQNQLKRNIIKITENRTSQLLCPIFAVPKKRSEENFRPIHDLRYINQFTYVESFKMETLGKILEMILLGDMFFSLDIKDGYMHIGVHSKAQYLFGFLWNNITYTSLALPFGYKGSPKEFSKIIYQLVAYLRKLGIIIFYYLNDILIIIRKNQPWQQTVKMVIMVFSLAGFCINWEKSTLIPSTRIEHLGFIIDSMEMTISITNQKLLTVQKILTSASNKISKKSLISRRELAQVCGMVTSLSPVFPCGKIFINKIFHLNKEIKNKHQWDDQIIVNQEVAQNLKDAVKLLQINHSQPIREETIVHLIITTDASPTGYGIQVGEHFHNGIWDKPLENKHINYKESMVPIIALQTFPHLVSNKKVVLMMDNQVAIAILSNQHSKSMELLELVNQFWKITLQLKMRILTFKYIPSIENTICDSQSRNIQFHSWEVKKQILIMIEKSLKITTTIDRFANKNNTKKKKYNSAIRDPTATAIDAFTQNWSLEINYWAPPLALLPKVIKKIIEDQAVGILVFPEWKATNWYILLKTILIKQIKIHQEDFLPNPFGKTEVWENQNWTFFMGLVDGTKHKKCDLSKKS